MPPKIPPLPPEPLEAIEIAAAEWLVLKDRGFTAAQQQDFSRWLALDPRHAEIFRVLESTLHMMDEDQIGAQNPARLPDRQTIHFPRRRVWLRAGLAAAATLAIGLFVWQRSTTDLTGPFHSIAATEVGALRRLDLPDGTVVQLNTDSAIEVSYSETHRRVKLTRGEAHFMVAKNRNRPFIVTASGVDVRAVGTAFNVRLRDETVDVLVTEGKVNVASPHSAAPAATALAANTLLMAGQRTSVSLTPVPAPIAVFTLPEIEIKHALAWQERRLDFDATSLADMAADINRYNHHKLIITDPQLGVRRLGGSFPAGDYETFVRLLENHFGVVADRRPGETHLRLPQ